MKGKKVQKNSQNLINNYSNIKRNNNITPSVNVLKFDFQNNQNNNSNFNFNKNYQNKNQIKNVRNQSQKPMNRPNNYYSNFNNNYNQYNNINIKNPQNNFMIINSNPYGQNQNPNMFNNNRNPKLLPINKNIDANLNNNQKKFISNRNYKAKSKEPMKIKSKVNNYNYNKNKNKDNNNDKIKIKLDEKGVYICDDEEYEYPNEEVNNLNSALKNKKENNLQMSQEENNMIETIKKVSTNRVKYGKTHQMLKEIGRIMNDPVVNFLIKKDPVESKNDSPSDQLSSLLSQKLLEEQKKKLLEAQKEKEKNEEDEYYENLQQKIKDEIRQKGSFDFSKLPDKDRKILAQRKLYNKIGKKVYDDNIENTNNNKDNIDINNNLEKEDINQKIDKQIKNEINRDIKKEKFFQEIEKYNEEDDYFNIGKINNKDIGDDYEKNELNDDININNEKEKEKPTARGILEKVLNKIEYKNQQLINHNEGIAAINKKKENKNTKNKNII